MSNADEVEIITPQQTIAEMKKALGACYTALAFELENAIKRQDELAIIQIRHAQKLAHEALERAKLESSAPKKRTDGYGDPAKGEYNAFLADDGSDLPCD